MNQLATARKPISETLERIIGMSVDTYYNPYKEFQWPETLPDNEWWMSPDLMTVHSTKFANDLSESQLMALSKWESIYFYSLNVHGIRELLLEVVKRVHMPGFEVESEFFHHFIGEENEHMWFFATFCLNYGHKIYPNRKIGWAIDNLEPDLESFLVFSRILIFEELVDFFNLRMARDESLHPIIRKVNGIHHQDESRHIAFGRELVRQIYEGLAEKYPEEKLQPLRTYLKRYIAASVESLYNPSVYRDAGIPEPYQVRTELVADSSRKGENRKIMKRTIDFYVNSGIVDSVDLN